MRVNKTAVERLAAPREGQAIYRDDELKGFGIRITAGGARTFIVEKRINGRVRRISIAKYPELTAKEAREEAKILLGKIAKGRNPPAEKREKTAKGVTLEEVFDTYLITRKDLKPNTVYDYKRAMNEAFKDWKSKPVVEITKDMVSRRHTKLGQSSKARANLAMRVLRALLNFAASKYEDAKGRPIILENPINHLSSTRAWYDVRRRRTVIKVNELPEWYKAVMSLSEEEGNGEIVRDYLLLLLFTGLRREEAASIRKDQVDLKGKMLTVIDTKNKEEHTLPLSDFLYSLLKTRVGATESDYVFPGPGKTGHIIFIGRQKDKVIERSGIEFTLHDLRRTFATIAESLDIPAYALKKLLNHKMKADVTAGYIVADVERLRGPMNLITDYILRAAGVVDTAKVIQITSEL